MSTSRRDFLARSAQLGVLLGAGVPLLQACGSKSGSSGGKVDPIADGLKPEKGPLKLFNYADYVNPDVIKAFESKYGVKVEITTFDSDSEAITKLANGAVKVDVHHSASPATVGRLIEGKLLRKLNKTYIPNFTNVLDAFTSPSYDPGSMFTVPYTIFSTGIGYRADRIDAATVEAKGWDLLWDPKYKGQVEIIDDYREGLALAMLHKGLNDVKDLNTSDKAVLEQAGKDLASLVGLVNVKVTIDGYKDIPEGTVTVAQCWNADMLTATGYLPSGVDASVIGYWYPKDDIGVVNSDCMGVMANATNPVLAHLYLDFMLDKANAELNFQTNYYLPAVKGLDADYLISKGYVPENLRNAVLSADQQKKGVPFLTLPEATDTLWQDTWSKFTAGG